MLGWLPLDTDMKSIKSLKYQPIRAAGFTLLELLVALAIFSIIGVAAYRGLDNTLAIQAQLSADGQRLAEVQFAMQLIERDIEQMRARSIRDEYGNSQPILATGQQQGLLMSFTRAGWDNPLQQARSQLQRVAYWLKDAQLIRVYWPQLDGNTTLYESTLLQGVESVGLRWRDNAGRWQKQWSATEFTAKDAAPALPNAVEISLELRDWGEIKRLLLIPAGS